MKASLKELLNKLTNWEKEHSFTGYGTAINITSYSSASNKYTIPANGLVLIQCSYRANMYIYGHVYNADDTNEVFIQLSTGGSNFQGNQQAVIPVFKGQKAYIQTNNTSYNFGQFVPYTY